jgi:hypothetical protein
MVQDNSRQQYALTFKRIFWFWVPLALMWLMMAVEQPVIAAFVARMENPEYNLASYGVTFALALFVESPIIMLLTAGTALAKDRFSYHRLLGFTHLLSGGLTLIHLVIALTPLFRVVVSDLIGAPEEIVGMSRTAFILLIPWTPAIAYRRLWQGVLIRYDRTKVVPVTIATRLAVSAAILAGAYLFLPVAGVHAASAALSVGVMTAAAAAYLYCRPLLRHRQEFREKGAQAGGPEPGEASGSAPAAGSGGITLTWRDLVVFYVPLALTSMILMGARPILTVGLARSPQPIMSLAAWPVILSVLFIGRSIALSYQEAVIALLRDRRSMDRLARFTWIVAGALFVMFILFVVTPLAPLWYRGVAGLSENLVSFSLLPTAVLIVVPAISAFISWNRGLLIQVRRTAAITRSVLVNVSVLVGVMLGLGSILPVPGALLAAVSLALSVLAEWVYLTFAGRKAAAKLRRELG